MSEVQELPGEDPSEDGAGAPAAADSGDAAAAGSDGAAAGEGDQPKPEPKRKAKPKFDPKKDYATLIAPGATNRFIQNGEVFNLSGKHIGKAD
jgi:hypothetical protein